LKALILAGGFGKRLRPYTTEKPKPLIEVAGKSILKWQIEWLKNYNVDEIVLAVGYLKEKIIEEIGSGRSLGVKVSYVVEEEPLGTGGGLKNGELILRNEKKFLVLNGDIIANFDLSRLINAVSKGVVGSISLVQLPSPYGIVKFDKNDGLIMEFIEKPIISEYWINAGVYCFTPEIFKYLPDKGDIERTAFPKLASEGKLKAVPYKEVLWKSIDTLKDIEEAERMLKGVG